MDPTTIRLDDMTLAAAKQLAADCHCTVEELVRDLVAEKASSRKAPEGDLEGFWADEPDLADRIMDEVYRTRTLRETH